MRRHPQPDNDTPESDADALQQVFALLLPIRRQRLRRSERQQRDAERALRQAENHRAEAAQHLTLARQEYQLLRAAFAGRHQSGLQKQERLMQGLHQEREASADVAGQRNQLTQCQLQETDRQQQLRHAQQHTQACQRDVEKLEYLIQHSEALR